MKAAPAFDCAECARRIGKNRGHHFIGYPEQISVDRLLCTRCITSTRNVQRQLHGKYYPDCRIGWHDLYDHGTCSASRAAAASLLGLWP